MTELPSGQRAATAAGRPQIHFTPPQGWMNDPNGLIKIGDIYHLFYQHNPNDVVWGNMHWGHATSTDLITWDHKPIALAPDEHGTVFSGTVVVDHTNTSGFGRESMVAIFTHDLDGLQRQSLAFSTNGGTSWSKYHGNPVLTGPEAERDYRDPKVLRYQSDVASWWVMALAVGASVWFYRSDNLIDWTHASQLALPSPWPGGIVEVVELVRVPSASNADAHWTLIWSVHLPSQANPVQTVYWARGSFDGEVFTPVGTPRRFDAGTDLYAVMAWDLGDGSPICAGWMNDKRAAQGQQRPWCGRLSLPRRLAYRSASGELHLTQEPILPQMHWMPQAQPLTGGDQIDIGSNCFALEVTAPLPDGSDETCIVIEDRENGMLLASIVVSASSCHARLPGSTEVPVGRPLLSDSELDVTIVFDHGSVELFADAGRVAASAIMPCSKLDARLRVESWAARAPGKVQLRDFETSILETDNQDPSGIA